MKSLDFFDLQKLSSKFKVSKGIHHKILFKLFDLI